MTTTKEPAATGDLDFANECGVAEEGREVVLIGPSFPLSAQPRIDIANEKSPGSNTAELIFAPAAAALEIIKETGAETGNAFANAGYSQDESRLPAGQPGGGQWTSAGGAGAPQRKLQLDLAPPRPLLSGGNNLGPLEDTFDPSAPYSQAEYWSDVAKVWEGYGDAITETVCGLWNTARHPINTAKGVAAGVTDLVTDPVGTLKAIGRQIGDDFTSGDPRKAGKLVGLVLLSVASPESNPEELASLLPKVEAAAAGDTVRFTEKEAGTLRGAFQKIGSTGKVGEDALKKLGGES